MCTETHRCKNNLLLISYQKYFLCHAASQSVGNSSELHQQMGNPVAMLSNCYTEVCLNQEMNKMVSATSCGHNILGLC